MCGGNSSYPTPLVSLTPSKAAGGQPCARAMRAPPQPRAHAAPPTVRVHAALTPTVCLTVLAIWTRCVVPPNRWLRSRDCGRSRGRHGPPGTARRDRFRVGSRRRRPARQHRVRAAEMSTAVPTSLAVRRTLATEACTAVGESSNRRHRTSYPGPRASRTARCGTDRCSTCTRSWASVG